MPSKSLAHAIKIRQNKTGKRKSREATSEDQRKFPDAATSTRTEPWGFALLPDDVRLKVWEVAAKHPSIICINEFELPTARVYGPTLAIAAIHKHCSPLLHLCRESRTVFLKNAAQPFLERFSNPIWVNFEADIFLCYTKEYFWLRSSCNDEMEEVYAAEHKEIEGLKTHEMDRDRIREFGKSISERNVRLLRNAKDKWTWSKMYRKICRG